MAFKQAKRKAQKRNTEAYVSIYTNGHTRFSKGARQQYVGSAAAVHVFVDREYSQLGFEPLSKTAANDSTDAYTLGSDATVSTAAILSTLGINPEDIDDGHRLKVTEDDDTGYLVVDLTDLVNEYSDAVACEECGRRCKNEQGRRTHRSKQHGRNARVREALEETDPSDVGESIPEGDDSYKELAENDTDGGGAGE